MSRQCTWDLKPEAPNAWLHEPFYCSPPDLTAPRLRTQPRWPPRYPLPLLHACTTQPFSPSAVPHRTVAAHLSSMLGHRAAAPVPPSPRRSLTTAKEQSRACWWSSLPPDSRRCTCASPGLATCAAHDCRGLANFYFATGHRCSASLFLFACLEISIELVHFVVNFNL